MMEIPVNHYWVGSVDGVRVEFVRMRHWSDDGTPELRLEIHVANDIYMLITHRGTTPYRNPVPTPDPDDVVTLLRAAKTLPQVGIIIRGAGLWPDGALIGQPWRAP